MLVCTPLTRSEPRLYLLGSIGLWAVYYRTAKTHLWEQKFEEAAYAMLHRH